MSGEKSAGSCNKFLANIFNKSKCQNCFKSRELHLLSEHDEEQAKPIYGGWLCLAPEGTDFDNRMQRSRKWQRRFFILYEHGRLSYALDELPSTLPQGTVNMNLCTDITDAEPRTGQRNALCVVMSEQEIFIRGDNKEIINGWSEQLAIYLHTNKKNPRKKHKMEPVANQEPSPAKMAATGQAELDCDWRQEEQRARKADVTPICTVTDTDPPGLEQSPAGNTSAYLCLMSSNSLTLDSNSSFEGPVTDLAASRSGDTGSSKQLAEPNIIQTTVKQSQEGSTADEILGLEATKKEQVGWAAASRTGRSDARSDKREKLKSCGGQLSPPPPQRRATSLDRRTSDTVMTPDLLNVKKGWLVKLDENDQWKKYWFVLSTDSLRYYKDSITEEASDLEGEINLMRCYNVSEYQVQRNYGFQIHTPKAIYTLSAMTAGIRKNWIHSLMKNIHPVNAPDVASSNMPQPDHIPPHHVQLPKVQGYSVCTDRKTKGRKPLSLKKRRNLSSHHVLCGPPDAFPKPDVTQDSSSTDISIDRDGHTKPSGVMERRCEGSYKTFDWTEFRLQNKPKADIDPPRTKSPCLLELGDLERRQRWEERRRKYESMLGFSLSWEESINKTKDVGVRAQNPRSQHEVEEEIEECWRQVEKTVFILERTVPLLTEAKDTVEMEPLLDNYRKEVEDLKVQLAKSEQNRLELQSQLHPTGRQQQQQQQQQLTSLDPPLGSEADFHTSDTNEKSSNQSQTQNLKDLYVPTGENVLREEQLSLEPSSSTAQMLVWLQNMHSSFQELGECQHNLPDSNDDIIRLNSDGSTTNHQKQLDRDDSQLFPTSETQMSNIEYKSDSLLLEKAAEGDHCSVSMEQHVHSDCAIVRRLSREVELLTSHNEALNQRNQEMLNQLTEADHEIEKLKAKFSSRYTIKPRHLAEVEQKGKMEAKELEQKLSLRTEELLAAQTLVTSLEENLRESETLLQLSVPTGRAETAESKNDCRADGCLLWSFEATEAKLTELERQPQQYEINCRELQAQNSELKDAEKLYCQRIAETVAEIRRLKEESDQERINKEQICSSGEKEIQQVIERMVMRLEALGKLLEMMDKLDLVRESEHKDNTHAEIWSLLLKELQARTSDEEKSVEVLLNKVTEHKMLEREMLLLGHNLCSEIDACTDEGRENLKDPDCVWNTTSVTVTESDMFDFNHQLCNIEHFRVMTQKKIALLKRIGSSLSPPFLEKLQAIADRLNSFHISENPQFGFMDSAAIEALCCCQLSLVQSKWEKEVEETKQKSLHCSNCIRLMEQNRELKAKLSKLEQAKKNVWCQTDESYLQEESSSGTVRENNLQQDPKTPEEQIVESSLNHMEISPSQFQQDENSDESQLETNLKLEMEQILVLRERVKELDELLSLTVEEMKEEFDENLSSVQMQHEMEMEKLKVACQRGFGSMEECHRKVVGGLQHRHQQEVEHILVERDQLLEEERAATVAAITAIKNAHRLELEREVESQPGCRQPENRNTILDEILRQHNEELASYQQELEVLSQQFSLKCLENGHLVQSLDAERKALCQCQQEIQDLRTRNQELSSHLVAEITRLCTLTEQGGPSLSQGMDIYEMEIALRVKEFEVQCLQQEITSLKDQLQFAQQDKRDATKKYKDMYMEMSIVRVKTERQMDELRENLRLAHQALEQTSL